MTLLTEQEKKLASVIIDALDLEDLEAEDIAPEAALFGSADPNSLGLDSIDALEISLAIAQKYGVHLKADDENNVSIFSSLRALTNHIHA